MKYHHSPGPWYIEADPGNGSAVVWSRNKCRVADIHLYLRQRAPGANVRLISASPDLLAALVSIMHITEREHLGDKLYDQMVKAIEKATGSRHQ